MLPFAHHHHGTDFIFQQDNARIHTSQITKDFLCEQNVRVMEWPPLSPDLNPIENLWGILSRKVYANGKQYHSINELKKSIQEAWDGIPMTVLNNLVKSMPNRCIEVLKRNGRKTSY
jgi:transposase